MLPKNPNLLSSIILTIDSQSTDCITDGLGVHRFKHWIIFPISLCTSSRDLKAELDTSDTSTPYNILLTEKILYTLAAEMGLIGAWVLPIASKPLTHLLGLLIILSVNSISLSFWSFRRVPKLFIEFNFGNSDCLV